MSRRSAWMCAFGMIVAGVMLMVLAAMMKSGPALSTLMLWLGVVTAGSYSFPLSMNDVPRVEAPVDMEVEMLCRAGDDLLEREFRALEAAAARRAKAALQPTCQHDRGFEVVDLGDGGGIVHVCRLCDVDLPISVSSGRISSGRILNFYY